MTYPSLRSLVESHLAKYLYKEQSRAYRKDREIKKVIDDRRCHITAQEQTVCDIRIEIIVFVINGRVKFTQQKVQRTFTVRKTCVKRTF